MYVTARRYAVFHALGKRVTVRQEYRTGDNGHVGEHHRAPDADIADLADHGSDDVRAARRAVMYKYKSYAKTAEYRAQNRAHGRILHYGMRQQLGGNGLGDTDEQGGECRAEDSAQHECPPNYPERKSEQQQVGGILRDSHRYQAAGSQLDEAAETGKAADDNLVREDEECEADGIQRQSEEDDDVVLGTVHHAVVLDLCHIN